MQSIDISDERKVDFQVDNDDLLVLVIDGEPFDLSRDDALRIAAKLQDVASRMKRT